MPDIYRAIADPVRRRLIELLADSERAAGGLAEEFPQLTREAVSRHLRVLDEVGLVSHRREAQRRIYSLVPERLSELDQWLARYRGFWDGRLTALDHEVRRPRGKSNG